MHLIAHINGRLHAIHTDHLNILKRLTDQQGQVVWQWLITGFGEVPPSTNEGEAVRFDLRYPGQQWDEETGLAYNLHRYYDPDTGRYIQADPIGLDGGWNRFLYGEGNPLLFVDPLGLETRLLTTKSRIGFRTHAAVFLSQGSDSGGPVIYDPAGSFGSKYGEGNGYSEIIEGRNATIQKFREHHNEDVVEVTCRNTPLEEEKVIFKKILKQPTAGPAYCSINSSWVLEGNPSFSKVKGGTFFPGNLKKQVERSR